MDRNDVEKLLKTCQDEYYRQFLLNDMATPGPWSACHDGDCKCGLVWGNDGNISIAMVYGPMHLNINGDGPDCTPDEEVQKANTKLIVELRSVNFARLRRIRKDIESAKEWIKDDISPADMNKAEFYVRSAAELLGVDVK